MRIADFRITRFQFRRDRLIGDSQVGLADANYGALELVADDGTLGLGFFHSLLTPLPALAEIDRLFRDEVWNRIEGEAPAAIVHRVTRPRGGNMRRPSLPFDEAVSQAAWDLLGKDLGLPLWRLLGGTQPRVKAYASGLDFHMSDRDFRAFFEHAAAAGFRAFKIKVGHPDVEWDLNRLGLLRAAVGDLGPVMIDANEAWSPKEAMRRLDLYRRAGFDIFWVEDPTLRDDFKGLRAIRAAAPWVHVNSGEYLDLHGKRMLIEARAVDILNLHGHITDTMRAGWLAAEHGLPVSLGNTTLELGVHMAAALPGAEWLEYSFQNYNHLVEEPVEIRDGYAHAPTRPGHGLVLSNAARAEATPDVLPFELLSVAPGVIPPMPDARQESVVAMPTEPSERRKQI
ncbi:MAG TPA: mandelate racemase/muconate lactonizing enzyme family protein [Bauldia sp.]|nr:mandelate racemase/muconate lactonizing enzyme family protein [Bauldia sp.]